MSELATIKTGKQFFHTRLLATTSSLALLCGAVAAEATETHPTVWIELGGQLERVNGGLESYAPPFTGTIENAETICNPDKGTCGESAGFSDPSVFQRPPRYSNGGEAKISFAPQGTDWRFSVALRYGRSNNGKKVHEQTNKSVYAKFLQLLNPG
ncbi:MAG TPA: hypothetical protein VG891_01865, partial [Rhizomicrobium sp.]|nr:hypothetical protein [Rhizomicrobium sp.]